MDTTLPASSHDAERQALAAAAALADGYVIEGRAVACDAAIRINGTAQEVVNAARWMCDILGIGVTIQATRHNEDMTVSLATLAVFPSDADLAAMEEAPCLCCECYYPDGQRCPNPDCPLH